MAEPEQQGGGGGGAVAPTNFRRWGHSHTPNTYTNGNGVARYHTPKLTLQQVVRISVVQSTVVLHLCVHELNLCYG